METRKGILWGMLVFACEGGARMVWPLPPMPSLWKTDRALTPGIRAGRTAKAMNTTKAHLVDFIHQNTGLPTLEIYETVTQLFYALAESLKDGRKIEIRGFGTFIPVTRKAKSGARNPRTGELCGTLPAYRSAKFRLALGLRAVMNKQAETK